MVICRIGLWTTCHSPLPVKTHFTANHSGSLSLFRFLIQVRMCFQLFQIQYRRRLVKSRSNLINLILILAYRKYPIFLPDQEFIRRFALHILPKGFVRIRHYGILSSCLKQLVLPELQKQLGEILLPEKEKIKHQICPTCKKGELITIRYFDNRGPPKNCVPLDKSIIQSICNLKS